MSMFDLNRRYNWPLVASIVVPIHIKQIHSSILMDDLSKNTIGKVSGCGPLGVRGCCVVV